MSYARYSLVADHLQYPGMPGIIALIGGGLGAAWSWARQKGNGQVAAGCAAVLIVLALGVLTWCQAQFYRDEETLWSNTLRLNDRAAAAYTNRGVAYNEMGDFGQSLRDFAKAIELKPDDAEAYTNRGNAYNGLRDFGQAIRDYTKAIELKPDFARAYHNRGSTYGRMGDFARAIQDNTKAIELEPDFAEAYYTRGNAYRQTGDRARAIQDYTRAIERKPGCADAYRNRAIIYLALKEYDKSWADVRMCRRLGGTPDPDCVRRLMEATSRPE
jgi:tetratricopeptide (TPR) repeat protein